jgi:CHAT domain-containing protein/tetratricopeptide (TPR) repeat protein
MVLHLLALFLGLEPSQAGPSPVPIELDQPYRGQLSGSVFEFTARESRRVAISLASSDFDASLRLSRASGADQSVDDGGIGTNAWVCLAVEAGERLRIEALARDGRAGEFELEVKTRLDAPGATEDGWKLARDFWNDAALRARSRQEFARVAECCQRLGRLFDRVGPLPDARSAYRDMLAAARQAGDDKLVLEARARIAGADLLLEAGPPDLEELESLESETRSPSLAGIRILVLARLGRARLRRGLAAEAVACHEEELALARASGSVEEECRALCLLGHAETARAGFDAAEKQLLEAIELAKSHDLRGLSAEAWTTYGMYCRDRGRNREAYDHFRRALELDPAPLVRIDVLGNLGEVLASMQRATEARRCFDESFSLARTWGLEAYSARHLLAFGNLLISLGDLDLAVTLLAQAASRERGDTGTGERAEILLSLAQARLWRQHGDDLARFQEEAHQALDAGRRAGNLRLQADAVILLCQSGNPEAPASDDRRELLEDVAVRSASSPDLETSAKTGAMLAWDDLLRGRWDKAIEGADRAYQAFADLDQEVQCLAALDTAALAAARSKDVEKLARALDRARLILEREDGLGRETAESLGLRAYFAGFERYTHDLVSLELLRPGLSPRDVERLKEDGFATAGAWKSISLVESMIRRRRAGPREENAELQRARTSYVEARQRLETLCRLGAAPAEVDAAHLATVQGRRRVEELEQQERTEIGRRFPDLLPRGLRPQAVRAVLPEEGTALIEYVAGTERLHAYVLTRDRFERIELGRRQEIESASRRLVSLIATNHSAPGDAADELGSVAGLVKLATDLYASLLTQPLAVAGPSIRNLVIVPSSEVAGLPFEALIEGPSAAPAGAAAFAGLPFLLRRCTVVYAPSSPALVELASSRPAPRKPTMLLLADAVYGGRSPADAIAPEPPAGSRSGSTELPEVSDLDPLVHTRAEVVHIASLMISRAQPPRAEDALAIVEIQSGNRNHHLSPDGFEMLLGAEATPDRFCELAGKYSILHIAGHGLSSDSGFGEPVLVLSAAEGRSRLLTCLRVLNLSLDADLVVLAACDTASGRRIDGDGVRSLARAFHAAGARTVLASLWEARDLEAGELMGSLYEKLLKDGMNPSAALRQVKLELLEGRGLRGVGTRPTDGSARFASSRDPYFWAGFVLSGLPK